MKLHQLEGIKRVKQKDLIDALKKAFEDCDHTRARELAKRILRDTPHLLDAGKANQQEACRICLLHIKTFPCGSKPGRTLW
jgi:hypothetical protein